MVWEMDALLGVHKEVEAMKKETGGLSPEVTHLIALVGWLVLGVSSSAVMARTRLSDALVHGRRVYIYHQDGIQLDVVDRLAKEVVKGGRFELVSARDQADLNFGSGTWSSKSTIALPLDGLHVPVAPNVRPGHVSSGRNQLVSEVIQY